MNFTEYETTGFFDEMIGEDGRPRAAAHPLCKDIETLPDGELALRQKSAERALIQAGITFNVYSDNQGVEKTLPFDLIPRIVSSAEWSRIDRGLKQRIQALNLFINDIYHDQKIVKDGVIPRELIASSKGFRQQCVGWDPPRGIWCHITGTDLIRHSDGRLTDVLYNASVYKDAGGNVLGVFAAARDVTQQQQASQYARSLIEASLDPLVTISSEGKITDVNEATIKVTGVPRDGLVGTDFSVYFTEPEKAREGYQQVFANGFVTDYPLTIRSQDGSLTDVLYNASVYKDARGNVLGVFAAARNVTDSKRVMREFSETKNLLDNILQSSIKYSIIGKDLEQRILSWNEGARRNYGYTAEEILGKNSSVLHVPEDVESGAVKTLLADAYDKGLAEAEFERVRLDGSRFSASVVVTRRNDAAGNPIGYLLMSSDISEKRQAEERLRSASQYSRSLIEASLDPLVTISPAGKITDVNEATIKVTGVPREELIGTDFSNYFTEPERARAGYQQVFAKGSVTDYPLTIRHRNHELTEVLYNASVYRDAGDGVLGVFAAARDVTAQKKAESEIAEQRGRELERLGELERFQKLTVGRELKMIELKKDIAELKRRANAEGAER